MYPRYLSTSLRSPYNTRYVADRLIVSCADGVYHSELGDEPRVIVDFRDAKDQYESSVLQRAREQRRCVKEWINIPVRDHCIASWSHDACASIVGRYVTIRDDHGSILVVFNCAHGQHRSATAAYIVLRTTCQLTHEEALARVSVHAGGAPIPPPADSIAAVRSWCDQR